MKILKDYGLLENQINFNFPQGSQEGKLGGAVWQYFWKTLYFYLRCGIMLWLEKMTRDNSWIKVEDQTPEKGRIGRIRTEMRGLKGPVSDGQLPG